jgi:hydrophobe/amphiphile efflux-1 (HAE1) family protein
VLAFLVLGFYGFFLMPVDFLPSIKYPMIKLHIWWRGATPEDIDKNLADPIERQMATVDGIDYLDSSAIEGMYTLLINFKYGVDVDVAYQDSIAAMARVARNLPPDIDPPLLFKADPSQLPITQITVSSDKMDLTKLRTWCDNWLQYQLVAVNGVAGTEIVGGLKREIRIHIDPAALEKYNLSYLSIIKRLKEENVEQFGGRVTEGRREFIARTVGEYKNIEDIKNIILIKSANSNLYLRDVAMVQDACEEARVVTKLGGKPCVKLSVLKQADANTVQVSKDVMKKLKELEAVVPPDIKMGIVENQADYIEPALAGVTKTVYEGAALVIIVIFLFLGSFRQVAIMLISLPMVIIINFAVMKFGNFSLNIFSLGGLVIAVGILLDNSIVVIENITRLIGLSDGKDKDKVIISAAGEVRSALTAATLSFMALFFPFLLVPGMISLLFRELILTISSIILISLLVALTVTPALSSIFIKKEEDGKKGVFQKLFEALTNLYGSILGILLKVKYLVLIAAVAVLILSFGSLSKLGTEFLPSMDDGRVMIKVKLPTGAALSETEKVLAQIENKLKDDLEIDSYFTLAGGKVWGLYTYEIANEGEINVQLVTRSKRKLSTLAYIDKIRPAVTSTPVPGGMAMVMQMPVKGIRKAGDSDIEVKVKGIDVSTLFNISQKVAGTMSGLKNFVNVHISMDMTKPEYQIIVDRQRAADAGISIDKVASTVRALIAGSVATRFRDRNEYFNIRTMISERDIRSKKDIEDIILDSSASGYLRVGDIARVVQAVGPVEIVREDQSKSVIVRGDVTGLSVGEALEELKTEMAKLNIAAGYELSYGGKARTMNEMKDNLKWVFIFAIFFSFIVLAVQFDSFKMPFLILGSVPFCIAGSIVFLAFTKISLSATVIIGLLIVIAAAVNDGVLLIEFADELKQGGGLSSYKAVLDAATIRLRPRVMTTAVSIAGLIPLALNLEEGGDMLQPMAVAAIGGLSFEIMVAMFLMPCLYLIFTGDKTIKADGNIGSEPDGAEKKAVEVSFQEGVK